MFSTKLNDNRRFMLPCIIVDEHPIVHSFLVDTGAKYTCCNIFNINPNFNESFFQKAETKFFGGFVHGGIIKYYKYQVKQFTLGTINLKTQDIWVTFDDRATDDVLGMDMLEQIYFMYKPIHKMLFLSDNISEIKDISK